MIKFTFIILILFNLNLIINCNLELCEKSLNYLINLKLNNLNNFNQCAINDNKFIFNNELVKFNIYTCKINYQLNTKNNQLNNHLNNDHQTNLDQLNLSNQNILIEFCLPTTCKKNDLFSINDLYFEILLNQLNQLNNKSINYFEFHKFINQNKDLIICSNDDSYLDLYTFSCLTIILIIIVILCTTIDYLNESLTKVESKILINELDNESNYQTINKINNKKLNKFNNFINNFSILNSINRLITIQQNDDTINCIYGFKVISIISIIIGHTYIYSASIAINYNEFKNQITKEFMFRLILNCSFAVDTFFTSSGLLLSYLLFKRNLLRSDFWTIKNLLIFYFNRYYRLTPVYAFILWFYTSFLNKIGDGPFFFLFEAKNCDKNYWHNLLYINNFDKFSEECMSYTWYLSNEMQFFILSPIFLFILSKYSCKSSFLIIGLIVFINSIITFMISYFNRLTEINGFLDLNNDHNYINLIYQKPYCRIGSYLIGLLTGYLIAKNELIRFLNLRIYLLIGDLTCFSFLLCTIFMYSQDWSFIECSFYFSCSRLVWSFSICWFIISCYLQPTKFLNRFLSLKIFTILSRLIYSTYLIHPILLTFYFYTSTQQIEISHSIILYYSFFAIIYSFIIAFILNLIVEIPFSNLNFLKKKNK